MLLLSSTKSRELDRLAIEGLGLSEAALMECAGFNVVLAMEKEWGSLEGRQIVVLCGKGNNGGDGMVAARHLMNEGASVVACINGPESELGAAAKAQVETLRRSGLKLVFVTDESGLQLAKGLFQ